MKTQTHAYLRWMIRKDVDSVFGIIQNSFKHPWSKEEIGLRLKRSPCVAMVAEVNDEIAGYMIYETHRREIELISFAVHPMFRRCGVGRTLIERLIYKLDADRRSRVRVAVPENSLNAQLFLRGMGFLCTQIIKDECDMFPSDAYLMEYFVK